MLIDRENEAKVT